MQHDGPFERRQTNRAILLVLVMALAAIAVNGGIRSFLASAESSSARFERFAQHVARFSLG